MNERDIIRRRMANQQLTRSEFSDTNGLVRWMGCIQAQDYGAATWAIGNRIRKIGLSEIERDFNEGKILRTHILRPTWHFIAPEDIRWMLKLTAGKVRKFLSRYFKKNGVEEKDLKLSKKIFEKELAGGRVLTRPALREMLNRKKINTGEIRMAFHLMDAELEGLLCSGPRQGKQFTYMLLEERVPAFKPLDGRDAVCEMTKRYFQSRGPATQRDLCWWSGLSAQNAKLGLEMNEKNMVSEKINGVTYWFYERKEQPKAKGILLLPVYDEYGVGYHDRSAIIHPDHRKLSGSGIFSPAIINQGKIAGFWKKKSVKGKILVEKQLFTQINPLAVAGLKKAEKAYERFLVS
jgi:Winged helix DNA-binding domain